jgi:nucleotide-binding universal stress UspA family protein
MKLLVGIDLSRYSDAIVAKAGELAVALSAKIWLVHVADPEPDFVGYRETARYDRDVRAGEFHREHAGIQSLADGLRAKGLDATALLVQGATAEAILKEASKLDVDMVVVGSHGRGAMHRLLVGSVSEEVLRKAGCPVLIIPTRGRARSS